MKLRKQIMVICLIIYWWLLICLLVKNGYFVMITQQSTNLYSFIIKKTYCYSNEGAGSWRVTDFFPFKMNTMNRNREYKCRHISMLRQLKETFNCSTTLLIWLLGVFNAFHQRCPQGCTALSRGFLCEWCRLMHLTPSGGPVCLPVGHIC